MTANGNCHKLEIAVIITVRRKTERNDKYADTDYKARRPGLLHRFTDRKRLEGGRASCRTIVKAGHKGFLCISVRESERYSLHDIEKMKREATELPWMQEFFRADIARPDAKERTIAWDWLHEDWTIEKNYYDKEKWADTPIMSDSTVRKEYQWVADGLDELLAGYGYVGEGNYYRVKKANADRIVLICHFGVECVMLSHLLGISPMVMWHGFCAAPTSVTTINTEERRKGIASFRVSSFGDISHLYAADEPPAFHARFCEFYGKEGERTD